MSPPGLHTASLTDVGRVRTRNEDSYGEFRRADGSCLLVVADGMGGHRAGATASRLAVESVGEVFARSDGPPDETLRAALEAANERVHLEASASDELRGMGTTAVLLWIGADGSGWVAHVGDSRLYRYRGDQLRPLTRDHSVVAELERRGLLSSEEAAVHPRRNEIMRSVGVEADVEVEVAPLELLPGDRYLLCSDGLSGMVDETEIAVILESCPPEQAVSELVARANEHGGHDNVTVQVAWIEEARAEAAPAPSSGRATTASGLGAPDRRRRRRMLLALAVTTALLAAALLVARFTLA